MARTPKSRPKTRDRSIGTVEFRVAGTQYGQAECRPGQKVHLEREHDNQHDPRAIRVENEDFRKIGYLRRRSAAWLSPLIDTGKVLVPSGVVTEVDSSRHEARLHAEVFLTPGGQSLLHPFPVCRGAQETFHETVLFAYQNAERWGSSEALLDLARRLEAALDREALPETFLLLELIRAKSRDLRGLRSEQTVESARQTLKALDLGPVQKAGALCFIPLLSGTHGKSEYVLLPQALKNGQATVSEVSEDGSVPNLKVINRGSKPILIPEGEILVGGKQNRTVNITVIVEAGVEKILPVSCVERGRWRQLSREFASNYHATPDLRARKTASVQASRARTGHPMSDQSEVWSGVSACLMRVGAESPTESVTEAYQSQEAELEKGRRKLELPQEAIGFLFGIENRIVGLDVFDSAETAQALWERLSDSYLLQSFGLEGRKRGVSRRQAQSFLHTLADSLKNSEGEEAEAVDLIVDSPDVVGSGVVHGGRLCHLAAFARPEEIVY